MRTLPVGGPSSSTRFFGTPKFLIALTEEVKQLTADIHRHLISTG